MGQTWERRMIAIQHTVQIKQGTAARVGTFSLAFATSDWRASRHRVYRGERCEEEASRRWAACTKRWWPRSAAKMAPLLRGRGGWWTQSSGEANSPCRGAQIRTPNAPPMWTPCHSMKRFLGLQTKNYEDSLSFECISRFMHLLGIVAPSFKRWCAHVGTCFCIAVLLFSK